MLSIRDVNVTPKSFIPEAIHYSMSRISRRCPLRYCHTPAPWCGFQAADPDSQLAALTAMAAVFTKGPL
jgi:hypothetical protein